MIHRPLRYIAVGIGVPVAAVLALALLAGHYRGSDAALALVVLGLLAIAILLVRHVRLLVEWARQPVGSMPPQVEGLWSSVFDELEDRFQRELAVRDKLSEELGRFQQAAQAMPEGLLYLAEDDSIEWLNVMAEQHFGLDRRRDLRVPIANLVRQPDFVAYLQADRHAEPLIMQLPGRRERALQVQIIRFAGSRRMVLSRDISKLQRLENMRRDFVANVSHEMRTPLTVVGGFLETLIDGLDDFSRDEVLHFLSLAHEQSSRMRHLIEDLLALSALETGAPAPLEERVDVTALMQTVQREAESLSAGRHTVTLVLEGGGELKGSARELHSAFSNLATNAVRYTPAGGHVELGWCVDAEGGEYWVRDDGIGIDPEHIPRLTERFYRVDRGRSRETGGTGLGLAIVKHILNRHQAVLQVDSEPGKGSRFAMRFPPGRIGDEN
ncbi:phosphate regulon sensor histidine kinase PhoR [Thauera sp. Sel9]|uniref:phosphate regulon sensor histidine kinase PhoR n=1 Tax=Thauera sp. Sel9 TaxID=2974299 RepID=UPI0021E12C67|nr:phosphate regulon sensor histidine kinase PhoR [Thauera sp. Sel9]MCV2216837.1 phosphate regulon sensor histidine kinase PhoR [Thauera sp. Sel9]